MSSIKEHRSQWSLSDTETLSCREACSSIQSAMLLWGKSMGLHMDKWQLCMTAGYGCKSAGISASVLYVLVTVSLSNGVLQTSGPIRHYSGYLKKLNAYTWKRAGYSKSRKGLTWTQIICHAVSSMNMTAWNLLVFSILIILIMIISDQNCSV